MCGIKWRQYTCDKHSNDLDDPILNSYIKCISSDLLCVWRKVRNTQEQPNRIGSENCIKELWIFWYGEEPDFNELVSTNLSGMLMFLFTCESMSILYFSEGEQGSWESGLSYECRSLLFKALHNLIEK